MKLFKMMMIAISTVLLFTAGAQFEKNSLRKSLRKDASRVIQTEDGTLVLGGKLNGWTSGDFEKAEKIINSVFDKYSAAYYRDPKSFHIGHFTPSYGYTEMDGGFEPVLAFLAPPASGMSCHSADECEELAKKDIIVAHLAVPQLILCPIPPLTYEETETKLLEESADQVVVKIIEYDKTVLPYKTP